MVKQDQDQRNPCSQKLEAKKKAIAKSQYIKDKGQKPNPKVQG